MGGVPGLLIVAASGATDPTRASIPFHIAVNGATPAKVHKPDIIANVYGQGVPPLRDLMDKCLEQNVPLYV